MSFLRRRILILLTLFVPAVAAGVLATSTGHHGAGPTSPVLANPAVTDQRAQPAAPNVSGTSPVTQDAATREVPGVTAPRALVPDRGVASSPQQDAGSGSAARNQPAGVMASIAPPLADAIDSGQSPLAANSSFPPQGPPHGPCTNRPCR